MTEQNTPVETDEQVSTTSDTSAPDDGQPESPPDNGSSPELADTNQAQPEATPDRAESSANSEPTPSPESADTNQAQPEAKSDHAPESSANSEPTSSPESADTNQAQPEATSDQAPESSADSEPTSSAEPVEQSESEQPVPVTPVSMPSDLPVESATPLDSSKSEPEAAPDNAETVQEIPFGFIDSKDRIHQLTTEHFRGRVIGKVIGKPEIHIEEYTANFQPLAKEVEVLEAEVESAKNKVQVMGRVRRMKSTAGKAEALGDFEDLFTRLNTLESTVQTEIDERRAAKEAIITQAEPLADSTDWRVTGDKFKELFQEWKKIGATGRDADDKLWERFIAPREKFNQARSAHYDQMREKWDEKRVVKQDIIVRAHELSTSDDWRETSIAMRQLMDEWKKAGSAGRQSDDELWKQFREAQQHFYDRRALVYEDNKRQKEQLCERAERLKDSTDWESTVEEMKSMMAEWKTIGMAGKRDIEDKLWNRFRSAQNAFFDRRYEEARARETQSREALKSKEELVAEIESLSYSPDPVAAGEQAAEIKAKLDELPPARKDREEALNRRVRKAMGDIRVNAAAEGARRSVSWEGKLREALERSQQQIANLNRLIDQQASDLKAAKDRLPDLSGDEADQLQQEIDNLTTEIAEGRAEIERLEGTVGGIESSFGD